MTVRRNADRVLIVNADDLGLTDGVTRGIIEAHLAGSVTSASLMVNTPGFLYAVKVIRTVPSMGVGLHLNFTAGVPLSPGADVTSLTDAMSGGFVSLRRLTGRAWRGALRAEELHREITAQFAHAHDAGIALTHVDAHQHAHMLPGMPKLVLEVARRFNVTRIRASLEPVMHRPWRVRATLVKAALHLAHRANGGRALASDSHFRGISLQGGGAFARRLVHELTTLPAGTTELIVHPGFPDQQLASLDDYLEPRAVEHAALTSATITSLMNSLPIRLATFATP